MLPSFEFIWKVFVSLFAIAAGIVALYWVCVSTLYLVVLAVDLEVGWANKNRRKARSEAMAKDSIGVLVLVCLAVAFRAKH